MDGMGLSWKLVTADEKLSNGPCDLLYAYLAPSGATTDSALYDGQNTGGQRITTLPAAAVTGHEFRPAAPVFCRQGLYVDVGTGVTSILVQWREINPKPPST